MAARQRKESILSSLEQYVVGLERTSLSPEKDIQIEAVSVVNVGVYNFSTLAFFFWEKIAFEISVCNIHLVAMSGHWWSIILFFTKIENVKKRVNFEAVFSLEGVVFLI